MEAFTRALSDFTPFDNFQALRSTTAVIIVCLLALASWKLQSKTKEPPALRDILPFIANTFQYMTNQRKLMDRLTQHMSSHSTTISKLYLGPVPIYMVTGSQNLQTIFRGSPVVNADKFMVMVLEHVQWFTKEDLAKFDNDKTGRLKVPKPGTENIPTEKRYWANNHDIFHEHLLRTKPTAVLADTFNSFIGAKLEEQPLDKWVTVRIYDYLKRDMAEAASMALGGKRVFEINPNFIKVLWDFDEIILQLVWGLPQWMNPKAVKRREQFNLLGRKFLENAFNDFDWNGPDADADWEPIFGSRLSREHAKWAKESGISLRGRAGLYMFNIFAINTNTIPVLTWTMMYLFKDPSLLKNVRSEVLTVLDQDPVSGKRQFNVPKLLLLPLLQSVYTEVMRLHVSINITRELIGPITLDGYHLSKGLLQAPTSLSHLDEKIWGTEEHSAKDFWAERHLRTVQKTDNDGNVTTAREFSLAGKSSLFFPYGGGTSMCPGRHFAKQEIILAVAKFLTQFDIEFVEWTKLDGSKSDRGPLTNDKNFGAAAVPPDRDMKIRWKRLW